MRVLIVLLLLAASLLLSAPAEARRVALVIGIDGYAAVDRLSRARNDAVAVASKLEALGFEVILRTDTDRRGVTLAMSEFEERLRGAEVGFFFFAGHGVEIRGTNVLLPADIPASLSEGVILREGLLLTDVSQLMAEAGVQFSVLIIDACRDNPLPRQAGRSVGRTRGLGRADVPRGTYVVYSAGIGEAALDRLSEEDQAPNSVFTRHLLPALGERGISLDAAVKQVRERVRTEAAKVRHEQNPAIYDQATGELFLAPAEPAPPAPATFQPPVAVVPEATTAELVFWQSIQASDRTAEFEAYLARWPEGIFAPLARARLAALNGEGGAEQQRMASPPAPAPVTPVAVAPAPQVDPPAATPATVSAVVAVPLDPDGVQQAQRRLATLGLDPGPADGVAGPRTRSAARAFQAALGLPADGELTAPLLSRLQEGSAPSPATLARALAEQAKPPTGPAEAARLLEAAARLTPEDAEAWLALGDAHRAAGANEQARRSFERARRADPSGPIGRKAQERLAALPRPTPQSAVASAAAAPGRGCGVTFTGARNDAGLAGYSFSNSCGTEMLFRANCPASPNLVRGDLIIGARSSTVVWAQARGNPGACSVASARPR